MEILISTIIEYTVTSIERQVGYLFSYKNNFEELIDKIKELEIAREDIKSLVEAEERKGRKIFVVVKNWLDKVDEIIDEAKQLCEDPRREMVWPFVNLWQRYQLSWKAKKMIYHVVDVKDKCEFERDKIGFEEDEGISQEVSESGPLHVVNHPVGLAYRVKKVISLLNLQFSYEVNVVGIYGIHGIGKSVIARAIYNLIAHQFQGSCFLSDVKENEIRYGLVYLQETFLSEIMGKKDIKLGHVNKGISIIQTQLRTKKVLLILDNIDKLKQLQSIVGELDWFGQGSRIIVTTRDKDLLFSHGIEKIYDVEEFNQEEALELFTWNAFKGEKMDPSYIDISKQIILSCNGLPLALEIVGSKLCGKNVEVWNTLFENPRRKIKEVFQASYNGWEEDEKEIFIDIMTRATQSSTSFVNGFYDVFLCFKGETRYNFTGHLYHALLQNGIRTFMDEELKGGEEISPTLYKAIEESRSAIIVFSKSFAFSRWCLDELVKILECKKDKDQLVLPLFYNVDPAEVRHQLGSYAEALAKHEERLEDDKGKLQRWRLALHEAANLSGWHLKYGYEYEYEFIQRVVKDVAGKIN